MARCSAVHLARANNLPWGSGINNLALGLQDGGTVIAVLEIAVE